jgi:hypothetical protein
VRLSIFILFCRPVRGLSGGLCGLGSLYQALENTIYTVSQLTLLTYGDMRAAIAEEMGTNATATATLTDTALLEQYYACKLCKYITRKFISKEKTLTKVTLFCLFKKWRYLKFLVNLSGDILSLLRKCTNLHLIDHILPSFLL